MINGIAVHIAPPYFHKRVIIFPFEMEIGYADKDLAP
jgi:hypothetical protein